jgi:2-oxoglutarate dehydrogenase E2 component (dihydrolipoamide succinyltransferase)
MNGWGGTRNDSRAKMTTLRKKVAERLVSVKNQTAMLTTFNEVDMSAVMALRDKYKDKFKEQQGCEPGLHELLHQGGDRGTALSPTWVDRSAGRRSSPSIMQISVSQ